MDVELLAKSHMWSVRACGYCKHRKLESVTVVNSHQPDGVVLVREQRRYFESGLSLLAKVFNKAKKSLPLEKVEITG